MIYEELKIQPRDGEVFPATRERVLPYIGGRLRGDGLKLQLSYLKKKRILDIAATVCLVLTAILLFIASRSIKGAVLSILFLVGAAFLSKRTAGNITKKIKSCENKKAAQDILQSIATGKPFRIEYAKASGMVLETSMDTVTLLSLPVIFGQDGPALTEKKDGSWELRLPDEDEDWFSITHAGKTEPEAIDEKTMDRAELLKKGIVIYK